MTFRFAVKFFIIFSIVGQIFTQNLIYSETSNMLDLKCAMMSSFVEMFPINYPRQENIYFELRTPCKRTQYNVLRTQEIRLNPAFNASRITVVFISGWRTNMNEYYTENLTKAYLCRGGFNFLVVNPSDSLRTEYINSAYNIDKIGEFIALGLKYLNIPGRLIHLMGHSLGAHVMGRAGYHFTVITQDKIGRITGFDPARPCFKNPSVFSRLSANDANYVDIIHSNVWELGTEDPIGDADFYSSGLRSSQPGCLLIDVECSHVRSIHYYIETVYLGNANNFRATLCNSYSQVSAETCSGPRASMGFASNAANGIYILAVNPFAPYGKNALNSNYLTWNQCGLCPK